MKNCKYDTKGHIISYENDHGSTITDYKALGKAMGLSSDVSEYSRVSSDKDYTRDYGRTSYSSGPFFHDGANPERDKRLNQIDSNNTMLLAIILTLLLFSIIAVVCWIFFAWYVALVITLGLFGVPLIIVMKSILS